MFPVHRFSSCGTIPIGGRVSDQASYRIGTSVGRLIEARVFSLGNAADADRYSRDLGEEVARHAGRTPVLCADHRPVTIYPQPVTDRLVELFQHMNERLRCVAIVVAPTNATMFLQLDRLVREAGFARRRVFRDPEHALAHLAEDLDQHELARARTFLDSHS